MDYVITTVTGKRVSITKPPDPKTIDLNDIAHALSLQCRYNGQIASFYNVADHCVQVARAVFKVTRDKKKALEGLLHDAHEAYTGDLAHPIKAHFKETGQYGFDFMEHSIAGVIMKKYGVDHAVVDTSEGPLYKPSEEVQDMDEYAYLHESFCFRRYDSNATKFVELFDDLKESKPAKSRQDFVRTFMRYS